VHKFMTEDAEKRLNKWLNKTAKHKNVLAPCPLASNQLETWVDEVEGAFNGEGVTTIYMNAEDTRSQKKEAFTFTAHDFQEV